MTASVVTRDGLGVGARRPWLTGGVLLVTLACGVAQLAHRPLYDAVVRDADRINDGQFYRLITGMFFQDGWASGLISNLVLLAVVGVVAERVLGRWRWAVLYFGCGWVGQLVSYLWLSPHGAGNSMCVAGLIGGLTAAVWMGRGRLPVQLRVVAFVVPVLAVADTVADDNHGVPCLVGIGLGLLLRAGS